MPSSPKKTPEIIPIDQVVVKLKPLGRFTPEQYVPVIWGILLLALLFLVLVLPGIRQNGTLFKVITLPQDASLLVDGRRAGAGGDTVFVAKGTREILLRKPGFRSARQEIQVKGRLLGSLFFPRRDVLILSLPLEDPQGLKQRSTEDFAAWGRLGKPLARYPVPSLLTLTLRDVYSGGGEPGAAADFLQGVFPLVTDSRQLADALRASALDVSAGAPLDAGNLAALAEHWGNLRREYPSLDGFVPSLLTEEENSVWGLAETREEYRAREQSLLDQDPPLPGASGESRSYGGLSFLRVPGGQALLGDKEYVLAGQQPRSGARPHLVETGDFFLMTRELSYREWELFIKEEPAWGPGGREALTAAGKADEHYLEDWTDASPPPGSRDMPLSRISWYAAEAFARWFSQKYLSSTGWEARLPDEDQWEYAARWNGAPAALPKSSGELLPAAGAAPGEQGIRGLTGSLAEWCRNPYRENQAWFRREGEKLPDPGDLPGVPDRPARGGSFADQNSPWPASWRGALPGDWSSPVVGFRLVLVPRES